MGSRVCNLKHYLVHLTYLLSFPESTSFFQTYPKQLDSQHDVASKQQRESSVTLKANESNENELEGKTQHIG